MLCFQLGLIIDFALKWSNVVICSSGDGWVWFIFVMFDFLRVKLSSWTIWKRRWSIGTKLTAVLSFNMGGSGAHQHREPSISTVLVFMFKVRFLEWSPKFVSLKTYWRPLIIHRFIWHFKVNLRYLFSLNDYIKVKITVGQKEKKVLFHLVRSHFTTLLTALRLFLCKCLWMCLFVKKVTGFPLLSKSSLLNLD